MTGSLAGRVSDKKAEFEMSPEGYISREQTNLTHRRTVRERGHNLPPKLGRKLLKRGLAGREHRGAWGEEKDVPPGRCPATRTGPGKGTPPGPPDATLGFNPYRRC